MISAADRKMIREAMEQAAACISDEPLDSGYTPEEGKQDTLSKLRDALALLDKPQPVASQNQPTSEVVSRKSDNPIHKPESADDADDLAVSIAEAVWEAEESHPKNASYEPWKIDIKKAITPILQAFASRIRAETLEEAARHLNGYPKLGAWYAARIRSLKPTGTP